MMPGLIVGNPYKPGEPRYYTQSDHPRGERREWYVVDRAPYTKPVLETGDVSANKKLIERRCDNLNAKWAAIEKGKQC